MIHFNITAYIGRDTTTEKMPYIKSHDTGVTFDISLVAVCRASKWCDTETPFLIPDGCKAVFRAKKHDGTTVLTDKDITISNNVISVPLQPQALTAVGVADAEIQLYGADGKRITSATFQYEVGAECVCDGDELSADYIDLLSVEIAKAVAAAEKAERIASHPAKVSENGTWLEWDDEKGAYVDTGISCTKGKDGDNGATPTIGVNGNWYINGKDTGKPSRGANGTTPRIGDNGNWWIGDTDTGVAAGGSSSGGMELLWENADVASGFSPQPMSLSNQNYSKLFMVMATYYYYDWAEYIISTVIVDGGALMTVPMSDSDGNIANSFTADMQFVDYSQGTYGAARKISCDIDASSGNVRILYFDAAYSGGNGYYNYDEHAMIPVRIYGIA